MSHFLLVTCIFTSMSRTTSQPTTCIDGKCQETGHKSILRQLHTLALENQQLRNRIEALEIANNHAGSDDSTVGKWQWCVIELAQHMCYKDVYPFPWLMNLYPINPLYLNLRTRTYTMTHNTHVWYVWSVLYNTVWFINTCTYTYTGLIYTYTVIVCCCK